MRDAANVAVEVPSLWNNATNYGRTLFSRVLLKFLGAFSLVHPTQPPAQLS